MIKFIFKITILGLIICGMVYFFTCSIEGQSLKITLKDNNTVKFVKDKFKVKTAEDITEEDRKELERVLKEKGAGNNQ